MAFVIQRKCEGVCDTACVRVCPCDCIVGPGPTADLRGRAGVQLFIDPDECIDCGACMPECPVDAIKHESELAPDDEDRLRNAAFFGRTLR